MKLVYGGWLRVSFFAYFEKWNDKRGGWRSEWILIKRRAGAACATLYIFMYVLKWLTHHVESKVLFRTGLEQSAVCSERAFWTRGIFNLFSVWRTREIWALTLSVITQGYMYYRGLSSSAKRAFPIFAHRGSHWFSWPVYAEIEHSNVSF